VVGSQRLRKLRSASIADLIGAEIELRRAEYSAGQWASRPTSMRPSLRPITHMSCQADISQRAAGRQYLRKLRSAGSADLVEVETELRRVEQGRHSVGQRASYPTSMRLASPDHMHRAPSSRHESACG